MTGKYFSTFCIRFFKWTVIKTVTFYFSSLVIKSIYLITDIVYLNSSKTKIEQKKVDLFIYSNKKIYCLNIGSEHIDFQISGIGE